LIRASAQFYIELSVGGSMFPHLQSFNLQKWIDENRGSWGQRRVIWQDSDLHRLRHRGPNRRKDYHINPGDEIFYQLEGELNLHYLKDRKRELAVLKAGDIFLMPKNTPHLAAPRRWLLDLCGGKNPNQRGNRPVYLAVREMRQ
jgi:mannose-6-phosphate isomerase-like protein (cupin superfamily)